MKETFETEQDALQYKVKHQLFGRVPEQLVGKWALNFPLKAHVTVLQPHGPTVSETAAQVAEKPAKGA